MLNLMDNLYNKEFRKINTTDRDYPQKLQQHTQEKEKNNKLKDLIMNLTYSMRNPNEHTLSITNQLKSLLNQGIGMPENGTPTGIPTGAATGIEEKNDDSINQKWIWPCYGEIIGEYGEQRSDHIHNGIDIAVPEGTPVKAVADGKVVVTGPTTGYGYWVGINHGLVNGVKVSSEYGHLSRWIVNNGQEVKQGQVIGYSGNTGHSEGPHLHLTIRHGNPGKGGGKAVNPWSYINRSKH